MRTATPSNPSTRRIPAAQPPEPSRTHHRRWRGHATALHRRVAAWSLRVGERFVAWGERSRHRLGNAQQLL